MDEELKSVDTLGDRMKEYERKALSLDSTRDSYVVIRLDGQAFHTWVKKAGLKKPFDIRMINAMSLTTRVLCESIQTCVIGYCQSDEISLVLKKGQNENSEPWFNNRVQKLCSITASICSVAFNKHMRISSGEQYPNAYFDARVIFLPTLDEVVNCLIWRQNDCIKNSVLSLAQSMFNPKQLSGMKREDMKKMMLEKGVDWDQLSSVEKYGCFIHRKARKGVYNGEEFTRSVFALDKDTPIFSQDKQAVLDAYNFSIK